MGVGADLHESRTPTALNQEERQSMEALTKEGSSIRIEKMKLFFSNYLWGGFPLMISAENERGG